jgi:hypothetical protein
MRGTRRKEQRDRIQAYVRPTADQLFKFDTSSGEILKGTESAAAQRYLAFDLELRQKGYTRMQTFNGSGGPEFQSALTSPPPDSRRPFSYANREKPAIQGGANCHLRCRTPPD